MAKSSATVNDHLQNALAELEKTKRALAQSQAELLALNHELESTNRGVVALYAELDEKAEQLRLANELKTRFFSNMSHEFRTPVNSILALAGLLHDRTDGDLTSEQARQVAFIRQSAQELGDLVNDLLDLVKVEAGHNVVRPEYADVNTLLRTLQAMFRPLAINPRVALVIEEPEPLPLIYTDETKVAQILRNFISNALKFTVHGEVRVSAGLEDDGASIVFAVADTGIGIPLEDQERIFQEFGQLENPMQRRVQGTGLGLALSRQLAQLLGGGISLDSAPGRGSTFRLHLPLAFGTPPAPDALAPLAAASEPTPAGAAEHILIIDDDEISRYVLRGLLAERQASISEAVDGHSGLRQSLAERPDVIFLDLVMPDLSGFEVLDRLGAHPATAGIPVIIFTSQRLEPELSRKLKARTAGVITKEISSREAAQEEIRAALERARQRRQ